MKAKASGVTIPYVIEERRPGDIAVCYSDPGKTKQVNFRTDFKQKTCLKSVFVLL